MFFYLDLINSEVTRTVYTHLAFYGYGLLESRSHFLLFPLISRPTHVIVRVANSERVVK